MYLCQLRLGPGAYQVTSYASAVRVSRGYMVCARARACRVVTWFDACRMVTWFAPVRVSHGYKYKLNNNYIKYILYNNAIYLIINNMHNILNYSVHRGGKSGEAMQP